MHPHTDTHKQHRVSDVRLTVLAGPVKSCSAAQWVFDRRSMETANSGGCLQQEGFHQHTGHLWPLFSLLTILFFFLSFFLFLFDSPLCLLPPCHAPLSNLFSLCVSCLFSDIFCFPLLSLLLPPCSVVPPSAELREGWYSTVCLFWVSPQYFLFFH